MPDIAKMLEENDFSPLLDASIEQLRTYGGPLYIFSKMKRENVPAEIRQEIAERLYKDKPEILESIQVFID